ncbi:hypothetical protein [Cognatishimia sp.]|uniref:hypothetical protein n=1 Tax=Cognatishimia sp. TaxID=2211648 RepID=UPI0035156A63
MATIGGLGLARHNTALFFLQIVCFGSAYQPYARFGLKNFLDVIKKDPTKIAGLSLSFIGFLAY